MAAPSKTKGSRGVLAPVCPKLQLHPLWPSPNVPLASSGRNPGCHRRGQRQKGKNVFRHRGHHSRRPSHCLHLRRLLGYCWCRPRRPKPGHRNHLCRRWCCQQCRCRQRRFPRPVGPLHPTLCHPRHPSLCRRTQLRRLCVCRCLLRLRRNTANRIPRLHQSPSDKVSPVRL